MRRPVDVSFGKSATGPGPTIIARKERHFVAVHRLPAQFKSEHVLIKGDGTVHVGHCYLKMKDGIGHGEHLWIGNFVISRGEGFASRRHDSKGLSASGPIHRILAES